MAYVYDEIPAKIRVKEETVCCGHISWPAECEEIWKIGEYMERKPILTV